MLNKSAKVLSGVLLALATLGATSAQANPFASKGTMLLSQLPGHDTYIKGNEQMTFDGLAIGRVRGAVGSIIQVELLEYGDFPGYIQVSDDHRRYHWDGAGAAMPGDDVLLRPIFDDDGKYRGTEFVSVAHPAWLTRLNLKEVEDVKVSEVEFTPSEPVALPPVSRPAPAPAPAIAPAPRPVRGLW
ncbi:MAG: hypothetical protein RLZZ490_2584 [Cyanobacteriota bacterium]